MIAVERAGTGVEVRVVVEGDMSLRLWLRRAEARNLVDQLELAIAAADREEIRRAAKPGPGRPPSKV